MLDKVEIMVNNLLTDILPPTISCPANIVTQADPGENNARVRWRHPVAIDNSGLVPSMVIIPAVIPPKRFPIGTNKITYIAEDFAKNKAHCYFTVTVRGIVIVLLIRYCLSP